MKKKIVISTLIMLSFLVMTVIGISPSIAAEKEFLIGSVGCMSGPAAMLGKNLRIGVEFAVEEINKTGGINGMNVRAIFRDDEADPTKALTLVRELVEKEKIHAFIGPTNTTCAIAIQPYLVAKKIIQLNGGTTGTVLIDPKGFPYSFRTHINDKDQAIFLVKEAIANGFKRIAVVHDTSALGMGVQKDMKDVLDSHDMTAATFATYNANDIDMLPVARKLKSADPDIILMFTLMADGARLLKAMERLDFLPPKVAIQGYAATALPIFRELAGNASKGVWSLAPYNSTYSKTDPGLPEVVALAKKIEAAYPGDKGKDLNLFTIFSYYDCAQLVRVGVARSKSLEADQIKAALESLDSYEGAQANYSFSSTDHEGLDPSKLVTVDANQLKHGMYLRVEK
ncbi:MAG: hypothetical protein VR64_15255 [Desulfatitalea sp. BRH_c12]|nr:MAG: hypothetical protein VR64_15255 [Desulfatitalea sp. BRH_c12]